MNTSKTIFLLCAVPARQVKSILAKGISSPILSDSGAVAMHYQRGKSNLRLLVVKVCRDGLIPCLDAYDNPHPSVMTRTTPTLQDWQDAIKQGKIKVPTERDWMTSLRTVGCVRFDGHIAPADIQRPDAVYGTPWLDWNSRTRTK